MELKTVNPHTVSEILSPDRNVVYKVPKYQREYTWGSKEWEALFDDLMENEKGYFIGTMICVDCSTDSIVAPEFEVIDGQQRLTTISLLLAALYTTFCDNEDLLDDDQKIDVLQIKRSLVAKNTQSGIRVVPQIQGNNRGDYEGLLSKIGVISKASSPKFSGLRRIEKAYNYFKKRIDETLEDLSGTDDKIFMMFEILEKTKKAILVDIVVSNHADAYTLFESLNNRGIPLTAVDLIKNLFLAQLDRAGESNVDYYFNRWTEIIGNLGEDYSDQERFFRQNYNAFRKELNAPFYNGDRQQYPLGSIATKSNLLKIYEDIIKKDPLKALEELYENAAIYGRIILNKTDELTSNLNEVFLDLQRVQGAPSYMLVLYLIKKQDNLGLQDTDIIKICQLLVNFFVRRNLTDIPPTRDLTRRFMSFIETIEQNDYTGNEIYSNLRNTLVGLSASDELFEERLRGPIYDDNSNATRFILCMLAKCGMTLENTQDLWAKTNSNQYVWSIEHIFPQGSNIPDCWIEMIADGDKEKAEEYQAQYVHTLGNLTLTGYNSTLGNKSFSEKKNRTDSKGNPIGYKNGLNLNENVCNKDKWTINDIMDRTDSIVKEIMPMFAL